MKNNITKKESPTQLRAASILALISSLMAVSISTTDAEELGALEMVELDQVESFSAKSSIFNRNIGLGRMSSLVNGKGYFGYLFPYSCRGLASAFRQRRLKQPSFTTKWSPSLGARSSGDRYQFFAARFGQYSGSRDFSRNEKGRLLASLNHYP
ncbi:MAG: hypothetical protein V4819_01885 [Verrucomicrobiota bacterium]